MAVENEKLSLDYIRGLAETRANFTFSTKTRSLKAGTLIRNRIPTFALSLPGEDEKLLELIRNRLGLKNKIYVYRDSRKDRAGSAKAVLLVRDFGSLKNRILPVFFGHLKGCQGQKLIDWLDQIKSDPEVPPSFRLLPIFFISRN